jgi:hypothetical protein
MTKVTRSRSTPLLSIAATRTAKGIDKGEREDLQRRRLGIEHLGDWLRYGGDAAALRRLAAEDLPHGPQ